MSDDSKYSARYSDELWEAIRNHWENTAGISYAAAAQKAAIELNIPEDAVPSKVAIGQRAKSWERKAVEPVKPKKPVKAPGKPRPVAKLRNAVEKTGGAVSSIDATVKAKVKADDFADELPDPEDDGEIDRESGLTPKQIRFVDEYMVDRNASQAALRAGYSKKNYSAIGLHLLGKYHIRLAIRRRERAIAERVEITADMVVDRYWQIATADPNELTEYRRENCRHCWGEGHAYQWTANEYEEAVKKAKAEGAEEPPCDGGLNFDHRRPPHPDCPECGGEGRGRMFVQDTRHLSPSALALFAGVEVTKDGLKIKMHNQMEALKSVGLHLGIFKEKLEITNTDFSPDKLEELFAKSMAAARARTEQMRAEREAGQDDEGSDS